jgi:hypothetical protein
VADSCPSRRAAALFAVRISLFGSRVSSASMDRSTIWRSSASWCLNLRLARGAASRTGSAARGLASTARASGGAAGIISDWRRCGADNGSISDSRGQPWIEDHERNVALGLSFSRIEQLLPSRIYLGAQQGVNAAGSRINEGANADVDPTYTKYLLEAEQTFALNSSWSLQFDLDGQVTAAVLPVLERFTFGGIGFGAAFDPATLSGDSGAEVSVQLAHVFRVSRWRLQYLRVYVRSDTGLVWNNSSYFYHRDEASSAGGGVIARWTHAMATLELSTPVEQPRYVSAAQSVRTFAAIAYVF